MIHLFEGDPEQLKPKMYFGLNGYPMYASLFETFIEDFFGEKSTITQYERTVFVKFLMKKLVKCAGQLKALSDNPEINLLPKDGEKLSLFTRHLTTFIKLIRLACRKSYVSFSNEQNLMELVIKIVQNITLLETSTKYLAIPGYQLFKLKELMDEFSYFENNVFET